MKRLLGIFVLLCILVMVGCTEKVDTSARYVFKEKTITGYLSEHAEYSEYMDILGKVHVSSASNTTLKQLLTARGNYTVFAPTNDAIQIYLDSLVSKGIISEPSWTAFPDSNKLDSIREVIAYNSIIDSGDDNAYYETATFPQTQNAEFTLSNMYDRKLSVHYCDDPDSILINDCLIDVNNRDILAINGVIHQMHQVVSPSNNTVGHLIKSIIDEGRDGYLVSAKLVDAVGLTDTLDKYRDDVYEQLYLSKTIPESCGDYPESGETFYTPEHRYYGFTFFCETDDFWSQAIGKPAREITVQDVMDYLQANNVYPDAKTDNDYEDPDNLLYQFVTYHFLPERLSTDRLVYHYNEKGYNLNVMSPTVAVQEFYSSMGQRRLVKLFESKESNGVYINRFPNLDNGRHGTYHETSCDADKEGILIGEPNIEGDNNVRNGIIYPINKLMVYSDDVRECLQKQRIRWNVTAMWPEFMNNDIRAAQFTDDKHRNVYIPYDNQYKYLDDVDISEDTRFYYWTGYLRSWANMQGDEMSIRGLLECTMRLPPVPKRGTYEIRFAIQCGGYRRGMVQFYWGSDKEKLAAMGIPIDLRQSADGYLHTASGDKESDIGFEYDTEDDDYNAEVDKRLHNNGFMKGCQQYTAGAPGGSTMMRESNICIRRIIIRQTMDPDKTYYIRFKSVMDDPTRFFYMDYLEYCAKDVYDNPETPEDIW